MILVGATTAGFDGKQSDKFPTPTVERTQYSTVQETTGDQSSYFNATSDKYGGRAVPT